MKLSAEAHVADLVAARPSRAKVLERYRIDYCCHGRIPLAESCAKKGLSTETVLEELRRSDEDPRWREETDWTRESVSALIDNIVEVHHGWLREELPRLSTLAAKVARAHGENHPEMTLVHQVYEGLKTELESHMWKEENVLFPLCRALETADTLPQAHCGSVNNPIRVMEHEHDNAARALDRMRELTGDYTPPDDACGSFHALLGGLAALEQDLHTHIHKENGVLFPRAAALESRLAEKETAGSTA